MNTEQFIAKRIIKGSGNNNQFSKPIVRISVLGISLGLSVMILTMAIVTGFQNEIRNKLIGFGGHIQISNYDSNISEDAKPIDKNQNFIPILQRLPEINHIQTYATKSGIVKTKSDNEGVILKGVGEDYDWNFVNQNLIAGNTFTVSDTSLSKNIVLSNYLANKLDLSLGNKMAIYFLTKKEGAEFTEFEKRAKVFYISGIYETGFEDIDQKLVLVDIGQIQKLNYWDQNQVGGFEVSINNINKIKEIGEEVDQMVGHHLIAQTIQEINPSVFSWLELQDINAIIVITLMILVAGINMISALLILILERTNMIGILKALGASNRNIQKIFLINATYLIGRGLIWGNIIGIGLALIQKYFGIIKLDQATYYVSVIPININIYHILLLNMGTLLSCLLMLTLPSFIISKITPVKAIRFS